MYSWKGKGTHAEQKSQWQKRRPGQKLLGENSIEVEELLCNKEQRHYARALREMNELVKLESLRIHLSRSDVETETDNGSQDYDPVEHGAPSCSHSEEGGLAYRYSRQIISYRTCN